MTESTLFIGAGAMGGAVLRGALTHGLLVKEQVTVTVKSEDHAKALADELGVKTGTAVPTGDAFATIILAVKPQVLPMILPLLKDIPAGTVVVSLAAGVTLETLEATAPQAVWYRVMPNTPVAVGAGMSAVAAGTKGTDTITANVAGLFKAIGEVEVVSEADLDRLSALSGAGPGYAFVIMDALADAGVRLGLPRKLAIKAAAQTLYGAGKLAVETGSHPAVLRDMVTSPGGTTIVGIAAMEKGGLRSAVHDGVVACYKRSLELGKK